MASSSSKGKERAFDSTLEVRWSTTKSDLATQLQKAIETEDGDMSEPLASAGELRTIWRLISSSESRPGWTEGEDEHSELERLLTTRIEGLGKAVTTRHQNASRSKALRLLMTPLTELRHTPEQYYNEALNALNQLDVRVQIKLDSLDPSRMDGTFTRKEIPFRRGEGSNVHKRTRLTGSSGMAHVVGSF